MDGSANLIFKRLSKGFYALRRFDILVDGKKVGSVANAQEEKVAVSPGEHQVELCVSRIFKSERRTVNINSGEILQFECGTPLSLSHFLIPALVPVVVLTINLFLSMTHNFFIILVGVLLGFIFLAVAFIYLIFGFMRKGKSIYLNEPTVLSMSDLIQSRNSDLS